MRTVSIIVSRRPLFLLWLLLATLPFGPATRGEVRNFKILHQFGANADGFDPASPLVQGVDGQLYGTTPIGGAYGNGTIFTTTPAGMLTTLYTFSASRPNGTNADGAAPGTLIEGSVGNFYGLTAAGGPAGGGTIFQLTPAGTLTVLHAFAPEDGVANPAPALVEGRNGLLYGITKTGGANGNGTVFSVSLSGAFTTLYTFTAASTYGLNQDGADPVALIQGNDGNLYGTTVSGGMSLGTFFRLTPAGVLTVLYNPGVSRAAFTSLLSLVQAGDGNFYFTLAAYPYDNSYLGSISRITPAGVATNIMRFPESVPTNLTLGQDGDLYGVAVGTGETPVRIFRLTTAGVLTNFYRFPEKLISASDSFSSVIEARDGNVYGVTAGGGSKQQGAVYAVTPAGQETELHSFTAGNGEPTDWGLVEGPTGILYGTTLGGTGLGGGTVFQITPTGVLTTLHQFIQPLDNMSADGWNPGPLVAGRDGNLYGLTGSGGANSAGTFFRVTPAGVFTVLHTFGSRADEGVTGYQAGLLEGSNKNFYVFSDLVLELTAQGAVVSVIYEAPGQSLGQSQGGAVEASPGVFYGCLPDAGPEGNGIVVKLTSAGGGETIYNFTGGADGQYPGSGLTLGRDGNLYGTTASTVFVITPQGALTTLATFGGTTEGPAEAPLIEGQDGVFYGAVRESGPGVGRIFRVTRDGALGTLYILRKHEGVDDTGLLLGRNGDIYGTTAGEAGILDGTIFRIPAAALVDPPLITGAEVATATVGQPFSYQIVANDGPASYTATGLPAGLILNSTTGLISGTPTELAASNIRLTAQSARGAATGVLTLHVVAAMTSAIAAPAALGR
jgi:uncharacterized repeat protein (TIGR03803 family)